MPGRLKRRVHAGEHAGQKGPGLGGMLSQTAPRAELGLLSLAKTLVSAPKEEQPKKG